MRLKPTFVFTPQKQEFIHDPDNGVYGDCQRAVIASLLGLPLQAVPHFLEGGVDGNTFHKRVDEFLAQFNLKVTRIYYQESSSLEQVLYTVGRENPGVYYCLAGQSLRDIGHVVICKDESLIHDPHPSNTFLTGPGKWGTWDVEFLTPITKQNVEDEQKSKYAKLIRKQSPVNTDHLEGINILRAMLNSNGFDAEDVDIEWAWGEYCEDTYAASWLDTAWGGVDIFQHLMKYLTPENVRTVR